MRLARPFLLLLGSAAAAALAQAPPLPDARYIAGLEAFAAGRAGEADGALAEFLAGGGGAPGERARAFYVRARIARGQGRPARAGELLLEARGADGEFARERDLDAQWRALADGRRPGAPPRLTAAQVFVLPGDRSPGAYLDGLQSAGFDTVILRCFQLRGDRFHAGLRGGVGARGVYFKTDAAPVIAPVLETVAAAAHARGLKVVAWLTTRSGDFLAGAPRDRFFDPQSGALRDSDRLDLFEPEARDRLHRLALDALAAGADGILFQDDLVYRSYEGFSPRGLRALKALPGAPEPRDLYAAHAPLRYAPAYGAFAAVKAALVCRFLGEAARLVHERRPDAIVLANVYYDSVLDAGHGRDWLAQDLPGALAAGADYLSIMAYDRQMAAERKIGPAAAAKAVTDMPGALRGRIPGVPGERLLFKLQTIDWESGQALPENEVLALFRTLEAGGYSLGLAPAPEGSLLQRLQRDATASPDF